jgi:hypothetical protein
MLRMSSSTARPMNWRPPRSTRSWRPGRVRPGVGLVGYSADLNFHLLKGGARALPPLPIKYPQIGLCSLSLSSSVAALQRAVTLFYARFRHVALKSAHAQKESLRVGAWFFLLTWLRNGIQCVNMEGNTNPLLAIDCQIAHSLCFSGPVARQRCSGPSF